MSDRRFGSSAEKLPDFNDAPSRGEALDQSRSRAASEMMLAARPRSDPESIRAGEDDDEVSEYHLTSPSHRLTSQGFPTNSLVHMPPNQKGYRRDTQDRKWMPEYEITQTGVEFNGDVKGIKFVLTQVASKTGPSISESFEFEAGKQKHQSQGEKKEDSGFVKQTGVIFVQSLTGVQAEVNQSVGGKELYKVMQKALKVEGEAMECTFPVISQHVW